MPQLVTTGFHHVTLVCRDARQTMRFYRDILGLAMVKLLASETAVRITDEAARIFASYGLANELPVQRYFRDARITEIYEGTSEIQKMVITDWVLKA